MKRSCSAWLVVYVAVALFLGHIVYRRFPQIVPAIIGGVVGGGIVWIGLTNLAGVWTKIAEALRSRRMAEGGPPPDGETITVDGTIEPTAATLTSPFTGQPRVAYKYEVCSGEKLLYDGFALAPCAIVSQHGKIRILAYPALQVRPRLVPNSEAVPNFSAYIERTHFKTPDLHDIRDAFHAATKAFNSDEGSIRTDTRSAHRDAPIDYATFTEWSIAPGDRIVATGRYSVARSALVPEPGTPLSVILRDASRSGTSRSLAAAFGNLVGAAIFLGIAAAGVLGFYAFIPLSASEQMSPTLKPTWHEVRLDRWIERRVRGRMRTMGMLDSGIVSAQLETGAARGRVSANGRDVVVNRAAASRLGDMMTIRIDDDVAVLTIDQGGRPLRLRFGNDEVDPRTFAHDLEVEITSSMHRGEVAGRFTYFRDDAETPACRVTFHAVVQ